MEINEVNENDLISVLDISHVDPPGQPDGGENGPVCRTSCKQGQISYRLERETENI